MTTTFSDTQFEMCYPLGIEHHWWNMSRSKFVLAQVKAQQSANAVFLEVGCGKGLEVKGLRNAGIDAYGVELANVTPLEEIQQFVKSGTDAVNLPGEFRTKVTGLLLLDVIEHLPEPSQFLRALEQSFPNLSVVIIAVPACQQLWSNYDVYYGHYRRYSIQMLEELGAELDWKRGEVGYFFHLLYFPARLLALFGVDRNTRFIAPTANWRWLHRLISYINQVGDLILPKRLKGSSAFAVYHVRAQG